MLYFDIFFFSFSIKKKVKGGSGGGANQPTGYKTLPSNSSSPVHNVNAPPPHSGTTTMLDQHQF